MECEEELLDEREVIPVVALPGCALVAPPVEAEEPVLLADLLASAPPLLLLLPLALALALPEANALEPAKPIAAAPPILLPDPSKSMSICKGERGGILLSPPAADDADLEMADAECAADPDADAVDVMCKPLKRGSRSSAAASPVEEEPPMLVPALGRWR